MICIEVKYQDGDTSVTRFNGTFEEAKAYYVGRVFNIGTVSDNLQRCTGIRLIPESDGVAFKEAGPKDISVGGLCELINGRVRLVDNGNGAALLMDEASVAAMSKYAAFKVGVITAYDGVISIWIPRK